MAKQKSKRDSSDSGGHAARSAMPRSAAIFALFAVLCASLFALFADRIRGLIRLPFVPVEPGEWQECLYFEAPSLTVPGNGVFAARHFRKGQMVWWMPMFVRIDNQTVKKALTDTVLSHYMFTQDQSGAIALGSFMVANSHQEANLKYQGTTNPSAPSHSTVGFGFSAVRDIKPGDELVWNYSPDGVWFRERGITESRVPPGDSHRKTWKADAANKCSKLKVGLGRESLQRISILHPNNKKAIDGWQSPGLLPDDYGWGGAIARSVIDVGELVQADTMLILPANHTRSTLAAPLVFEYEHLTAKQLKSLRQLRSRGLAHIWYNEGPRIAEDIDIWEEHNVALLPLGNIPTVRRVGLWSPAANCEIDFVASESGSLEMHLFATRKISVGEVLAMASPPGGTAAERSELALHLVRFGQPTPAVLKEALSSA